VEQRIEEIAKDVKATEDQFTAILDGLREEMGRSIKKQQENMAEEALLHQERVGDLKVQFETMLGSAKKAIDDASKGTNVRLATLTADLALERKSRISEKDKIMEEFAFECMRREKDEACIIESLEHMMRQIKNMQVH